MKRVLVLYSSLRGHTARVSRRICESIEAAGGRAIWAAGDVTDREVAAAIGGEGGEESGLAQRCGARHG